MLHLISGSADHRMKANNDSTWRFETWNAYAGVALIVAYTSGWTKQLLHNISVAICVPARDEAAELPRFLASIAVLDCDQFNVTLNVFFDGCSDDSEQVVDEHRLRLPFPVYTQA